MEKVDTSNSQSLFYERIKMSRFMGFKFNKSFVSKFATKTTSNERMNEYINVDRGDIVRNDEEIGLSSHTLSTFLNLAL